MNFLDSISSSLFSDSAIGNMLNDVQFANRFRVELSQPTKLQIFTIEDDSFMVKSFNVPNVTLNLVERNYSGIKTKVVNSRDYDSFSIVFYEKESGKLRAKFHEWENYIFNRETGKLGYYKNYISNMFTLQVLSTESKDIMTKINFHEVFPISIGDITYDRDSKDTLIEFSVTFSFKKLTMENATESKKEDSIIDVIKDTFTF